MDFLNSIPAEVYSDPTVYAIPLFVLVILIELGIQVSRHIHLYEWKDSIACMSMGLISLFIGVGIKSLAYLAFAGLYEFRLLDLDSGMWWYWIILWFADDFSFYWHHRLSHEIRLLWAAHVNHHSSEEMNFSVALRQSWTEIIYKYVFWLWLPILGFQPLHILFMISINLIFQFFQHTRIVPKLGPLEWFFNTPSHHRVHHAVNVDYLDRNYAGTLIIWDRLFGSFQEENESDPPIFGITQNINTYNPVRIAFHEYGSIWQDLSSAPDLKNKLNYLFRSPGWSHKGPDLRAETLRRNKSQPSTNG